jgi:MFS family permease
VTALRHRSPLAAGIAVTGSTLAWTAGAWVQARLAETWEGRRLVRTGLVIILAGIAGMILMLQPAVPLAEGLAAWTLAGSGMGLAYAPLSLLTLRLAPPGREGQASASLNLADVLGTALGIGVGGAAVAATARTDLRLGVTYAFAIAAAVAVAALALTHRLPAGTTAAAPANADIDRYVPKGLRSAPGNGARLFRTARRGVRVRMTAAREARSWPAGQALATHVRGCSRGASPLPCWPRPSS